MYDRGSIVVAVDPFGRTPRRPYVIASTEGHPFHGEQFVALGITTTAFPAAIDIDDAYATGSLSRRSYIAPWAVVSLRDSTIDRAVARLESDRVDTAVDRLFDYLTI